MPFGLISKVEDASPVRSALRYLCTAVLLAPAGVCVAAYLIIGFVPEFMVASSILTALLVALPLTIALLGTRKSLRSFKSQMLTAQQEVAIRIDDLARANTAAQQARLDAEIANNAKSNFLSQMSHELRTPLNAIIGFSEILRNPELMKACGDSIDGSNYANMIHQSGCQLVNLVDDLLDLSKIEAGEVTFRPAPCALHDVFAKLRELLGATAQARGQTLDFPQIEKVMSVDRKALEQILLNLLTNAITYSPDGACVRLTFEEQDDIVVFHVEDSGPGMSPKEVEEALLPFKRLSNAHVASENGTGLGLPIVAKLVEQQGGELIVKTAPGEGSTFSVQLARELGDTASAALPHPPSPMKQRLCA